MSILPDLDRKSSDQLAALLSVKSFHDVLNIAYKLGVTTGAAALHSMNEGVVKEIQAEITNELGGQRE